MKATYDSSISSCCGFSLKEITDINTLQSLQVSWKYCINYFKFMVIIRTLIFFFSSVMVYYRILNIVPCAVQ